MKPCTHIPEEWEIPFEAPDDWTLGQKAVHADFMKLKRARQIGESGMKKLG